MTSTRCPLVTVVTPSYNQGRFIRQTIESVLTQDYPKVEYLVMDGGSSDETVSILREYSGRLQWVSGPDRGQASAINEGWRRGRGEILAWLNSDDMYLPGAIRAAVSHLSRWPEDGAVYGEGYHTDESGRVIDRYPTEPFDLNRLSETCFICQPTVFMRRSVVAQVGYVDEALQFCMDYDLWIRIGRISRFGQLPRYLSATRLHGDTKTLGRRCEAYAEVLPMIQRHYGCVPPSWIYAYSKAVAEAARTRRGRLDDARFVSRLVLVGFRTFLRYNRRVPVVRLLRWRRALRPPCLVIEGKVRGTRPR
jgi:glycosyltransferase involved in cell wall biosynthesis